MNLCAAWLASQGAALTGPPAMGVRRQGSERLLLWLENAGEFVVRVPGSYGGDFRFFPSREDLEADDWEVVRK